MSYATKEQLEALAAYMASKISVPTIGIGGGYAPIGTIISYMGTTAPADYLACDGSVVNIADYPQLATFFETQFGSKNYFGGDGVTTFGVPSLPSPSGADYIYCIKHREQNTYSTDEQRVGTWIDGKPLYQITLDMGLLTNKSTKTTNHNISNIDKIVDINGIAVNSTEAQPIPKSHDTDIKYQIQVTANQTSVSVFNRGYDYSSFNAYVTLKYTKTTD